MAAMNATLAASFAFAVVMATVTVIATPVPSGAQTLLVLNKSDATLSIIDPANGKTVASVPTGEGPHELAVSADGKLAFVANYGAQTPGNSISVIDLAAKKELRRFDVSPLRRPHGLHVERLRHLFRREIDHRHAAVA